MLDYLARSTPITVAVVSVLSVYFLLAVWIFVYRYRILSARITLESKSLSRLYMGRTDSVAGESVFAGYLHRTGSPSEAIFKAAISDAVRSATRGLTPLSIIASTSPFVGLFGTVVGILEAFGRLGNQKSASLSVVAPAISEALIATAAGIFVAIFAYAFHLFLKRKAYELSSILESEAEMLLAQNREPERS